MYMSDAYKFYINDILLPQTPASITISNANHNDVFVLANGRPFTVPKFDGPQTFEFEFEITQKAYPYTFKDSLEGIRFYTDLVWQLKQDRDPITLTIIRSRNQPSTCVTVLLDDYSYTEDAENASDYIFKIKFTEYHPQNNQELDVEVQHHLVTAGQARGWADEVNKAELEEEARIEAAKADAQAQKEAAAANKKNQAAARAGDKATARSPQEAIINTALSQVGYTASDSGSKYGSGSWCAWFVKYCANASGVPFPDTGYCPTVYEWARNEGRFTQTPAAGYYILFDKDGNGNPDHIGIVKEVTSHGILTIEGNTSGSGGNGVWEKTRDDARIILGYVNPY